MGVEHVIYRELSVRLGGRRVGPLFLGGHYYTVGPITAIRYIELSAAIAEMLGPGFQHTCFSDLGEALQSLSIRFLRPLCPLIILEEMRPRDFFSFTPAQFEAAWSALLSVNDFPWVRSQLRRPEESEKADGTTFDLFHMAMIASVASGGAYSPEELLKRRPIALLLSIIKAQADINGAGGGNPPGSDPAAVKALEQLELETGVARLD